MSSLSKDKKPGKAKSPESYSRSTKRLAYSAMFAALAIIFSYIEFLIPVPIPIPGVKLGIANLVIIIAMYRLGFKYAFTINCARIVAAGLLFSGFFGIIYGLAGGILSLLIMYLLYRSKTFSMVGVSMAGGVIHNFGQLVVASFLLSSWSLMSYFSILVFAGIASGVLTGFLAYQVERRLPKSIA